MGMHILWKLPATLKLFYHRHLVLVTELLLQVRVIYAYAEFWLDLHLVALYIQEVASKLFD